MKKEATSKPGLPWIILPALLTMAYVTVYYTSRLPYLKHFIDLHFIKAPAQFDLLKLTGAERFLFEGDLSRARPAAQMRAVWEKHPDQPAYFGHYISKLLPDYLTGPEGYNKVLRELKEGERIDPGNARYNYLMAVLYFSKGQKQTGNTQKVFIDQSAKALAELKKAQAKNIYQTYSRERIQAFLSCVPKHATRFEELRAKADFISGNNREDWGHLKSLVNLIPGCVEWLASTGNMEDATWLLESWPHLIQLKLKQSYCLNDYARLTSHLKNLEHKYTASWNLISRPKQAVEMKALTTAFLEPWEHWNSSFRTKGNKNHHKALTKSASMLHTGLIYYYHSKLKQEDLEPARKVDFLFFEQIFMTIIINLFFLFMMGAVLVFFRCGLRTGTDPPPAFAYPSARATGQLLACGVVIPLAIYFIYSRWFIPISARDYSFYLLRGRFFAEFLLLGITLLALSSKLFIDSIRKRCRAVDLEMPPPIHPAFWKTFWLLLIGFWACSLLIQEKSMHKSSAIIFYYALGLGLLFTIRSIMLFLKGLFGRVPYRAYRRISARALIPLYGFSLILLSLTTLPYLSHREAHFMKKDRLARLDPETGLSEVETETVQEIKALADKAWAALPK